MLYFSDINELRRVGTTTAFKELSRLSKKSFGDSLILRDKNKSYQFQLTNVKRSKEQPTITEVLNDNNLLNSLADKKGLIRAELEVIDYRNKSTALVFKISNLPKDFKVKDEKVRLLIRNSNIKLQEELKSQYKIKEIIDDVVLKDTDNTIKDKELDINSLTSCSWKDVK